MKVSVTVRRIIFLLPVASALLGCTGAPAPTAAPTAIPLASAPAATALALSPVPATASPQPLPTAQPTGYAFPKVVDPSSRYLFYLHGQIIEDQGLPATSPVFGDYEYEAILQKLSSYGFVVISEQRPKNTDSVAYAHRINEQVAALLDDGVPAQNITVVGASKGAGITVYASHFMANEKINYVLLAICNPGNVQAFKQGQIGLFGNVLSIYDASDELAGSCQELFSFSEGKGLANFDEIVLNIGTGHGILYQPLDEWVLPTVEWANQAAP